MAKITKSIDIEGERITLAKSDNIWGWRVVHPIKNDDGKINWLNLIVGGKGNLVILLAILFIVACAYYGFHEVTKSCADMAEHPCDYFRIDCSVRNEFNSFDIENLKDESLDMFPEI